MKLSVGELEKPLLTASIKSSTLDVLMQRPGFEAAHQAALATTDVRFSSNRPGDRLRYSLLASRLGRRPHSTHEARLGRFVDLVRWFSIAETFDDGPVGIADIDVEPCLDGFLPATMRIELPAGNDQATAVYATNIMYNMGRQLRYARFRDPSWYRQHIRADIKSADSIYKKRAYVQTGPYEPGHYYSDPRCQIEGRKLELISRGLTTYKEQVMYIVGAVALATADTGLAQTG